jgi:hypothetical protein
MIMMMARIDEEALSVLEKNKSTFNLYNMHEEEIQEM